MNQQINLFQPIFRKETKIFSFAMMLKIMGLIFLALILISAFIIWKQLQFNKQVTVMRTQFEMNRTQLENVTRELNVNMSKEDVERQIQKLKEELDAHTYLNQLLEQGLNLNSSGFSQHFIGFSRQVLKGLWIQEFKVSSGKKQLNIMIKGRTLNAELIASFIDGLTNEPRIRGSDINLLAITRNNDSDPWLEFVLATNKDDLNEAE